MRLLSFRSHRAVAVLSALAAFATGCANDAASDATRTPRAATRVSEASGETIDLRGEPYRPGPVTNSGAIVGRVVLDGPPADAPTQPAPAPCADSGNGGDRIADAKGGAGDVVVWIANARSGKATTVEKRYDLDIENCAFVPVVQAAVTGSTFNVFNDDRELHRLVFLRLGTTDTLTTMPFFNDGQVVASERLASAPGVVEVRCARHPGMHAYIAVFEHPYFAVTEPSGTFRIDSLPPGRYRLMAWRRGLSKPVDEEIQVTAGRDTRLDLAVRR